MEVKINWSYIWATSILVFLMVNAELISITQENYYLLIYCLVASYLAFTIAKIIKDMSKAMQED